MPDLNAEISLPRKIMRGILLVLLLAVFVFALRWLKNSGLLERALQWIQSLGPWGPVMFILIYIGAVICSVPASILTLGAGFAFGMVWGSVYVLTAALISASVTFLISRHLARDWIGRRLATHPKFRALDEAVAREGWKIVALVRLAPVFPFAITNYAFGLTRVPHLHYLLASLTMIPSTLMYVYFGTVGRDLTDKVAAPSWIKWAIGAVTVVVVIYVMRFAKKALSQKIS